MSALPGLVSLLLKGRGCSGPQAQGWRCCARLGIKVLQTANPCKGSHLLHILRARVVYPGGASGKESVCQSRRCERLGFNPWRGKIPWRREWCPHPVFLPGKYQGQRSLVGCNPWGCKESDKTVQLSTKKRLVPYQSQPLEQLPKTLVFWALLFCGSTAHPLPHRWSSQACRASSAEASLRVLTLYHP